MKGSDTQISHLVTLGSTDVSTFCVKYDPFDKHIAQGCSDGSINIYNSKNHKKVFSFNTSMEI